MNEKASWRKGFRGSSKVPAIDAHNALEKLRSIIAGHTVSFQEHRRIMHDFIDKRAGHFLNRPGA